MKNCKIRCILNCTFLKILAWYDRKGAWVLRRQSYSKNSKRITKEIQAVDSKYLKRFQKIKRKIQKIQKIPKTSNDFKMIQKIPKDSLRPKDYKNSKEYQRFKEFPKAYFVGKILVKIPNVWSRYDREELSRCLLIKRNRDRLYCSSSSKAGSSTEVSMDWGTTNDATTEWVVCIVWTS